MFTQKNKTNVVLKSNPHFKQKKYEENYYSSIAITIH